MDWSFFDDIRCINLYEREDRYQRIKNLFDKHKIPVTFYRTNKNPTSGLQGCYESHIAVMREAYNKGANNLLIFEDDVDVTSSFTPQRLNEVVNFLRNNDAWEIFFLGTIPEIMFSKMTPVKGWKNIYKMRSFGGHAYIVSRSLMERLISAPYLFVPNDIINMFNPKAYGCYPSMFVQTTSKSDTGANCVSSAKTSSKLFRAIEMYGRYINFPMIRLLTSLSISFFFLLIVYIINPKDRWIWLLIVFIIFLIILLISDHIVPNFNV